MAWHGPIPMRAKTNTGHLHFIGAGGIAVSALCVALKARGFVITGTDENILPPADGVLARGGIKVFEGYSPNNIAPSVTLAVLGASISRDNPEVAEVMRRRIPFMTWPAMLGRLRLLAPHNGVVAGTDGKTTTSCMWAWIMDCCGRPADRVIGGKLPPWEHGVRLDGADHCILEGDEYPCGLGDMNSKFMHYEPEVVVVTNVHFDHPDAFSSGAEIVARFQGLCDILPPDGLLIYNAEDSRCRALAARAACPATGFGFSRHARERITQLRAHPGHTEFRLAGQLFSIPQMGRMNAANAAAAALAARHWGVPLEKSAAALRDFPSASERQKILRDDARLVLISDTAYHPHAVAQLLRAVRLRYPGRRLGLVLQPRHTCGKGNWQQSRWPAVLPLADRVILTDGLNPPHAAEKLFSAEKAASEARARGADALHVGPPEAAAEAYDRELRMGDVWVLCLADWFKQPRSSILNSSLAR